MNQQQANRLVELIEYFEGLPEGVVDLQTVGTINYDAVGAEQIEYVDGKVTIDIKECGSTYCLAGHLPYAFPDLYTEKKEVHFVGSRLWVEYGYPTCKGIGGDHGELEHVLESFKKNFGIPANNETLMDMVWRGGKTGYYAHSDRGAVIEFLKDQLSEHGYEIAEVSV